MEVNSVGNAPTNYAFSTDDTTDTIGKEDFLTLMVTQMQNQDPLDPISNEEYLSQLAQFTSLEQMMNLNDSMENQLVLQTLSSASNLIDKEVDVNYIYEDDDGETQTLTVTGTVTEITVDEGNVLLTLDTGSAEITAYLGDVTNVR